MTEGMMGRGSDTRIYNPRSESSYMFRNNHEEDTYGHEDGYNKDKRMDKKQAKKEKEEKAHKKIKHIKIKPHHMGLPSTPEKEEMNEDDSDKRDAEREITAQTGSPDVGGFLTSLANQAKGPGAAGGQMMQMSEPMNNAWSDLLKRQKRAWETSTKPFRQPKGGFGNEAQQSNRRAKYVRRENPTGPMAFGDDTSVEYSHRGLAVKQPMSQADMRRYKRQLAQIKQRKKHLGNIRVAGPRLRTRSDQYSAPMGAPSLTPRRPRLHPVRAPPIVPPKMRRPSLTRPKMPSMVTMSEDSLPEDSLLKAVNKYQLAELRNIMREMRNLLRDKRNEKKKMAEKDVSGGASSLPKHNTGPSDKTTKPTGPTESEDARNFAFKPSHVRGGTA